MNSFKEQRWIFGDSAYKKDTNIGTYVKEDAMPPGFRKWNNAMKRVRISIEWNYGYTGSLFAYVRMKKKLKLMQSDQVAKVYKVATILRNIYVMYNGCQTSNYFGVTFHADHVKHYIRQSRVPAYMGKY